MFKKSLLVVIEFLTDHDLGNRIKNIDVFNNVFVLDFQFFYLFHVFFPLAQFLCKLLFTWQIPFDPRML
jgi:hypothetical protein